MRCGRAWGRTVARARGGDRRMRRRSGRARRGLRDDRSGGDGTSDGPCHLQEERRGDRNRPDCDDRVRIDGRRLIGREFAIDEIRPARRTEVGDGRAVERDEGVFSRDRGVVKDEGGLARVAADDDLPWRQAGAALPARHQHAGDGWVRHRHGHLTQHDGSSEVERDCLIGRQRKAPRGARSVPAVDQHELPALIDDPGVVRRDAWSGQDEVTIRSASDDNRWFSESWEHSDLIRAYEQQGHLRAISPRAPKARPLVGSPEPTQNQ